MSNKRVLMILGVVLAMIFIFTGCSSGDSINKAAVDNFEKLFNGKNVNFSFEIERWTLLSTDGDVLAFDSNSSFMEFDLSPFLKAGLEPSKLSKEFIVDTKNNRLRIEKVYGTEGSMEDKDLLPMLAELLDHYPDQLAYHKEMGRYGLKIGKNAGFEWAVNPEDSKDDIVFILDPKDIVQAGADPEKIEGFKYTMVELDNGSKEYKLIKSFDILK
ncbi:MAG: hypothetical protein HGA49_11755 [Eubacteriaceae bacterium]|nr:hypothetical protein [Eubacteriaceae bacterium]